MIDLWKFDLNFHMIYEEFLVFVIDMPYDLIFEG
jgi:hypothetical protein